MNISLEEWLRLCQKKTEAREACRELETLLTEMIVHPKRGDQESMLLLELLNRLDDATFALARMDMQPQSEWMGGPTEGPGSEHTKTYLREPNCCPGCSSKRYFTAAEVQAARDAGLLQAGPDVTGPKADP